jgi:hypothetical protein
MNDNEPIKSGMQPHRSPWRRGKLVGPKPPLRPSHVRSIRTTPPIERRMDDLTMFNLAIDGPQRTSVEITSALRIRWQSLQ